MSACDNCCVYNSCGKIAKGEVELTDYCIRKFKMNALFDAALMSDKQRRTQPLRYDADGTDREQFVRLNEISQHISQFVKDSRNLYLFSAGCGNGKTSWALRMLQEYVRQNWFRVDLKPLVLFINVPKFFLMLKDNISQKNEYIAHIKECVAECDIVVWDDIGTKMGTEFEVENLLNIINNRIDESKTNIYTSNITPDQLRARVGERLYSRIINMSEVIELKGADKRGV